MVLDPNDPTKVKSLTVFVEGDDNPVKTLTEIHQPDNIETTRNGLLLTEDPGSSQQFPVGSTDPAATTARLWHVPFANPADAEVVAKVNQSADGQGTDVDGRPPGNQGAWESTGIVDASEAFGPGTFLINVQAHTLWVEKAPGDDNNGDGLARLHVQARRRAASADPHPWGIAHQPEWGPLAFPDRVLEQHVWRFDVPACTRTAEVSVRLWTAPRWSHGSRSTPRM